MSKFKVRMKLQGLEIEIEGTREDVPLITENLGQQIAGLIQPAGAIIDGEAVEDRRSNGAGNGQATAAAITPPARKRRARRVSAGTGANGADDSGKETALDWKHEPEKYGNPSKDWSGTDKAVWLLYVTGEAASVAQLSANRIAATFNKHFYQAGEIHRSNVQRDLGRRKVAANSPVSEDTTKIPSEWYLTEGGRKKAQELVNSVIGTPA